MKRTTIFIPEELERDLRLYATREGKAVASVVREAVAAYILDRPDAGALPSFAAAFDSGHTDTADRHDEVLFGRLTPHEGPAGSSYERPRESARRSRPAVRSTTTRKTR